MKNINNTLEFLKERWGLLLSIAFLPEFILPVLITIALISLSYYLDIGEVTSGILITIATFFAGYSGKSFNKRMIDIKGNREMQLKGQSAVRNLTTINQQISNIDYWSKNTKKFSMSEISRHIDALILNISSALADWADVVPEVKDEISEQKKIQKIIHKYQEDLIKSETEIAELDEKNKGEREILLKELEYIKIDLERIKELSLNYRRKFFHHRMNGDSIIGSSSSSMLTRQALNVLGENFDKEGIRMSTLRRALADPKVRKQFSIELVDGEIDSTSIGGLKKLIKKIRNT